jgi:U3 small nucleolar RNA-associated protein 20
VNHIIKNLGYYDEDGRLQLIEVLGQLVEKFPLEVNDKYAEIVFFSLMLRAVNEESTTCK